MTNMWVGICCILVLAITLLFSVSSKTANTEKNYLERLHAFTPPNAAILFGAMSAICYCLRHPNFQYKSSIVYVGCCWLMMLARAARSLYESTS